MGTGAFGAGLFGMNMECERFFGPESEGLFFPVTGTLCGVLARPIDLLDKTVHLIETDVSDKQTPMN